MRREQEREGEKGKKREGCDGRDEKDDKTLKIQLSSSNSESDLSTSPVRCFLLVPPVPSA
eukprot:6183493-Pleurochrysis_carterae.AAC.2